MSIVGYVFVSLTRACAESKCSAQVVIHKVEGLASDSLAQGVGHGLSQVCDDIRSTVITWMSTHWEEGVDYPIGIRHSPKAFRF